ncbi:MAG: MlaD family protein [Solirubrobacteraceae bacterium]
MRRGRGTASLVASPVLVGAVTVLIAIIAVFIAYNANAGLPFVPTYDIKADIPSGAKLVEGNEVRAGGFRVGVVDRITPRRVRKDGKIRSVAEIDMKLDKVIDPLRSDTRIAVRPRSALGLKYVELTPGSSGKKLAAGARLELKNSREGLELEDVYSTLNEKTRDNARAATEGFGDAFAGRGQDINTAIQALNPLFANLTPVMRNLNDPDTGLDQFFRQIGKAAAQVAPVARTQAVLFTNMADTFAAIGNDPAALQATIEKSPSTIDTAVRSFRVQRPFLADFADLSRRLRPAAQELPRSLPKINVALRVGTPVLRRSVALNNRVRGAFRALDDLFKNPNTLLALRDLRTTLRVTKPAVRFIAPYQKVCDYWNYFIHPLGEHQSQQTMGGTVQNQGLKFANPMQANNKGTLQSSRPVDVAPPQKARGAKDAADKPLDRLFAIPYQPAIDAQGNADCQNGQNGYPNGPFSNDPPYPKGVVPGTSPPVPTGVNAAVTDSNYPVLSGGTYRSRQLGIKNLKDLP